MIELATMSLPLADVLVAAGSSDDDGRGFGLLFLLAGPVFYWIIYMRYRNSDKRHRHEAETEASTHEMRASDSYVQARKGLSSSKMRGANYKDVRGSVH